MRDLKTADRVLGSIKDSAKKNKEARKKNWKKVGNTKIGKAVKKFGKNLDNQLQGKDYKGYGGTKVKGVLK